MTRVRMQLRAELMLLARNGEQLLLTLVIPVMLLAFFGLVDVLPSGNLDGIDFLVPGIVALAIMSTSMVSLGIATGFERSYLVLKRLGATPLTRGELVAAKVLSVFIVEIVQVAILVPLGAVLGWNASSVNVPVTVLCVFLGTASFAGIGILLAGRLRAEINLAAQNGLYLLLLLLGGMVIPTDSLPGPLASAAAVLPSTALSTALRSAMVDGVARGHSLIILVGWALVVPVVAARRFRWS